VTSQPRRAAPEGTALVDQIHVFRRLSCQVDGLAAVTPDDPEAYTKMAERIVARGYRSG
jgi:hypothetical protein